MIWKDKRVLVILAIVFLWFLAITAYFQMQKQSDQKGAVASNLIQDEVNESEKNTDTGQADSEDNRGEKDVAGDPEDIKSNENTIGGELSSRLVVQKAIEYINDYLLAEGSTATSDFKVTDVGRVYKFNITVDTGSYDVFATADGSLIFPQAVDMTTKYDGDNSGQAEAQTQFARPDVKVFVMSYCPYGLQAQKMYYPVYEILKDKADMGIYFVNYAMHGQKELDENLRQYCIQSEQGDKFAAYLKCFTASGQSAGGLGAFDTCMNHAGVDTDRVLRCVKATDEKYGVTAGYNERATWVGGSYPKFAVNDDLNDQYGVQGSPTIIINGKKASVSPRSPQQFLKTICDTFANVPKECETVLDDAVASTGFGGGAGSSSSGGCGG